LRLGIFLLLLEIVFLLLKLQILSVLLNALLQPATHLLLLLLLLSLKLSIFFGLQRLVLLFVRLFLGSGSLRHCLVVLGHSALFVFFEPLFFFPLLFLIN